MTLFLCYVKIDTVKEVNKVMEETEMNKTYGRTSSCNYTKVSFNSINDLMSFIKNTPYTPEGKTWNISIDTSERTARFTKTNSFEEAADLLYHGWESGAKLLTTKLNARNCSPVAKNKTVYDVAGYQCSVPRYLQGIPTNMIQNKRVAAKTKVANVVKNFAYASTVSAEMIEEESAKFLEMVQNMEQSGTRCNVFVTIPLYLTAFKRNSKKNIVCIDVKIKDSTQRMNIKQMAFPLMHPSMLRRIIFNVMEKLEETKGVGEGHGYMVGEQKVIKETMNNVYYIPAVVEEQNIKQIEKYFVKNIK